MKHKNVVKLLADGKTVSRLTYLKNGQAIRIQSKGSSGWRWCTFVDGKKTNVPGTWNWIDDRFVVSDRRYANHAKTYRRGQAVSEGIMVELV